MSRRCLVTGASGFIGRHLCERLTSEETSISVVLRDAQAQQAHLPSVERVHTSLDIQPGDLAGIDTIYHLAGLAHGGAQSAGVADLQRVNVEQTAALYRAAVAADVRCFVWLSSIKVMGGHSDTPFSVEDTPAPPDDYAMSKLQAENVLMCEPSGTTQLHIVRPPLVYGPNVGANFLTLMRYGLSGLPLPFGGATAPRAWLGVGNLVDMLVRLSVANVSSSNVPASKMSGANIWHVRDEHELSVAQMLRALAEAGNTPSRLFTIPASAALQVGRWFGLTDRMERLFLPLQVDDHATRQALDWHPPFTHSEELAKAVTWYQQHSS